MWTPTPDLKPIRMEELDYLGVNVSHSRLGKTALLTAALDTRFTHCCANNAGNESALPYDQHYLLALIAPRNLATGAAYSDTHADPNGQYLSACAAKPMWELYGKAGLLHPDSLPAVGDYYNEGSVAMYAIRKSNNFFISYFSLYKMRLQKYSTIIILICRVDLLGCYTISFRLLY